MPSPVIGIPVPIFTPPKVRAEAMDKPFDPAAMRFQRVPPEDTIISAPSSLEMLSVGSAR